ncbi:hypothetical protein [Streptomyces boninensis]|uniref:hypothetical protein n=1 Tax=Streptomyces boninensis TaxID=2039455 RepID=UPI003B225581
MTGIESPLPEHQRTVTGEAPQGALDLLTRCLANAVSRMPARIDLTDETDLVSQDVLLGLTAKPAKHCWMFQAEQQHQLP